MKAILLAAGFGTRLRPLTNSIPKCLVPIKGEPLINIWLKKLVKAGIDEILINTHYLPRQVEKFISGSEFKNNCKLIHEPVLIGTAGTLIENLEFLDNQTSLLIHADNYCIDDLRMFIDAHNNRPKQAIITMMTFRTTDPSSCGIVEVNKIGIVEKIHEKIATPPGNLANGAVYILSPEFLTILKNEYAKCKEFTTEVLVNFVGKIYTYETKKLFLDIGTPENYYKANL
jgi:mannose-1-phosphate guanylyltransferase